MNVVLKKDLCKEISVRYMKDGDIGVIISWPDSPYQGIVQRYKNDLITIGKSSGYSWPQIFTAIEQHTDQTRWDTYLVRILQKGEELIIQ